MYISLYGITVLTVKWDWADIYMEKYTRLERRRDIERERGNWQ